MIHLTEIEDCRVLQMLLDSLPRGHGYRAYLIPDEMGVLKQNVGLITRIDPVSNLRHVKGTMKYPIKGSTIQKVSSGSETYTKNYVGEFRVHLEGEQMLELLLCGLHLTANPQDPFKSARREAQAALTANDVSNWFSNHPTGHVVIMGDFNDFDPALSVGGKDIPMSQTFDILLKAGPGLSNAMRQVPVGRRGTHRGGSTLDHILLGAAEAKTVQVLKTQATRHKFVSDHRPVLATIVF